MDELEGIDVLDVERELCRLPDVAIARLVSDDVGRVTEVHIVARGTKHPKQIARDVQSVALASFGLEIDRRVISVVQLADDDDADRIASSDADAPAASAAALRPVIERVSVQTTGLRAEVRVGLRLGEAQADGRAEGSIAASTRHRLVAIAAVDALRRLVPSADAVDVDDASILRVGGHDVAVVTLIHVAPPAEHVLSGSAVVTPGHSAQAVVRAVLDATNRRLGARG